MRKKIEIEVVGIDQLKAFTLEMNKAKKSGDALGASLDKTATSFDRFSKSVDGAKSSLAGYNTVLSATVGTIGNFSTATKNATSNVNTYAQASNKLSSGTMMVASNTRLAATSVQSLSSAMNTGTSASQGFFASFLRYQLLSRVFGEITKAASESVQAMIEIDKQAARVARVTNHGDRGIAAASIASDSARSGLDFKTVGEGYYQLTTQLGNVRDASGAMQTAMNLVVGTESDMRDTTRALSQIYYEFGGQLDQSVGKVENFRRVGEAMAITYKMTNTEVSELTSSLKYLAPIAAAARVAPEQIFAIIGALDKAGIRGSMAGTGPSSFISNVISKYDDKLGGIVSGKNLATFTQERNAKGGQDVIKTLQNIISVAEQLGRTDTSKAEKFLQTVSGSQRSFRFVGAIAALKDAMNDMVNIAPKIGEALYKGGTHYAEDIAKEMKDTFEKKIAVAWQSTMGVMGLAWNNFAKNVHLNGLLDDIAKAQQGLLDIEKLNQSTAQGLAEMRDNNKNQYNIRTRADAQNAIEYFAGQEKTRPQFSDSAKRMGVGQYFVVSELEQGVPNVMPSEGANIISRMRQSGKIKKGSFNPSNLFAEDTFTTADLAAVVREMKNNETAFRMEADEQRRWRKPTSTTTTPRTPAKGGLGDKPAKGDGGRGAERFALDMSSLDEDIIRLRDGEDAAKLFRINSEYRREMSQDPRRANLHRSLLLGELAKERTEKAKKKAEEKADERERQDDRTRQLQRKKFDFTASDYDKEKADARDELDNVLRDKSARPEDKVLAHQNYQNAISKANKTLGWSILSGAMGSLHAQSQHDKDIEQGEASERMDAYGQRMKGIERGFRRNALGTSEGDELVLLEAKRQSTQAALDKEKEGTENWKQLNESLKDANASLIDFKDNLEKQAYERGIAAIGRRSDSALFELEMSQGVVGSSGAYGQSMSQARGRVGIYAKEAARRKQAIGEAPTEALQNQRYDEWIDSVKEFKRASKELADLPLRRFIEQKEQVQSTITGGFIKALRTGDKHSIGAGFQAAGDMIVNKALENQINKWFDPVASAAAKQIIALDRNTQAINEMPQKLQGAVVGGSGASGSASGGGIAGLVAGAAAAGAMAGVNGQSAGNPANNGPSVGIPQLANGGHAGWSNNGKGQNAAGKYMAAYSVFNQGMEQGITADGVISGAMAGAQLGGVPGAIIGGLTSIIGGLFHKKKEDPLENRNNWNFGSQNAPDRFFYEAYRYEVTKKMPTAAQLGMTNTDYKPPVVNIYIDGKKAMDSQISKSINGANSSYSTQNFQNVP